METTTNQSKRTWTHNGMTATEWKAGDLVRCNGFDGRIERCYIAPTVDSAGMYDVRLPGGGVCVSAYDIEERHPEFIEE